MIKVPLITMDANSRSLGTFIENFKGIIDFESYNDKVLDSSIPKMVVFFEYVGDNDLHFENFANFFKTTNIPTFLVIDDSYEGLTDDRFLDFINNLVKQHSFIKDWTIITNNKKLNTKNKTYFNVQLFLDRYDDIDVRKQIGTRWSGNSNLRKKKFLCVNRQERLHRLLTVNYFLQWDIAKHSYLSCPLGNYKYVLDGHFKQAEYKKYLDVNLQNVRLTKNVIDKLKQHLPLSLDLDETTYLSQRRNLPSLENYFAESYVSVITEGDFYDDNRQAFTEKVLKCFLYKHPFIVIGLQDTLKLLRELGFITFNDIIDERYDSEPDANKRLTQALEEVRKLNEYNIHDLRDMYNNILPILEYNRQHYLNLFQQKQPVELLHKIKSFVSD